MPKSCPEFSSSILQSLSNTQAIAIATTFYINVHSYENLQLHRYRQPRLSLELQSFVNDLDDILAFHRSTSTVPRTPRQKRR
jgi:hypothetical protein